MGETPKFDSPEDQEIMVFLGSKDTVRWPVGKWKRLSHQCSRLISETNGDFDAAERFLIDFLKHEGVVDPLIINQFRARNLGRLQDFYGSHNISETGPQRSGQLLLAHREYERRLYAFKLSED